MTSTIYRMQLVQEAVSSATEYDFFILASGSDSRAYHVWRECACMANSHVVLMHFKERLEGLASDDPLYEYDKISSRRLTPIFCEIKNPSSCVREFEGLGVTPGSRVALDISCFTKPYIFFLLKLIHHKCGVRKISAFYTEPKSYLFPRGLFANFRTNSGPLTPWEIPGFSGVEERGAKRTLVILLGFDGDLSREINAEVSPTTTYVVNGFPAYTQKFKDISLIANEKLVSDHNNTVLYARANNPFEVYNLLNGIMATQNGSVFVNVAPLGTKPMALGACLFALHNPEVRVVYPLPNEYESKYSDRSWNSWRYELPLARV